MGTRGRIRARSAGVRGRAAIGLVLATLLAPTAMSFATAAKAAADWQLGAPTVAGHADGAIARLPDGRILLAGGDNGAGNFASNAVDIYSPATGTSSPVASMGDQRFGATANVLADGRVLVCGGTRFAFPPYALQGCERYDPALNLWLSSASMPFSRVDGRSVSLPDGRVLEFGGTLPSSNAPKDTLLFDPTTNTWNWTVPNFAQPAAPALVLMRDGRVLVAGGSTSLSIDQIFDPASNSWTSTSTSGQIRTGATATVLPTGKVLVAGGSAPGPIVSAQIYDPVANTWAPAAAMHSARSGHVAVALTDGRVLVAGGLGTTAVTASAEIYDPVADTWTAVASLDLERQNASGFLLDDGTVGVVGGTNSTNGYANGVDRYDPPNATYSPTGPLSVGRDFAAGTALATGDVLIAGGNDLVGDTFTSAEIFHASTSSTTLTTNSMHVPHRAGAALLLTSGKVLVEGGADTSDPLGTDIYDPTTDMWNNGGAMHHDHTAGAAVRLGDGRVLVAGGYDTTTSGVTTSAEIYDPTTNTWSNAADMNVARELPTATVLHDGRVLVAGGFDGSNGFDVGSAEVYDPVANAWTPVAFMSQAREGATAALLSGNRVLVAGGQAGSRLVNSAEIYDPATDAWSSAGTFHTARVFHSMVSLPGGQQLLIGGSDAVAGVLSSIELYDPHTNQWYDDGDLSVPRSTAVAALMTNGRVVLLGGTGSGLILASDISAAPAKVKIANLAFTPSAAKVKHPGDRVRWTNTKGHHTVTDTDLLGDDGSGNALELFTSGSLGAHATWDHVFTAAGTYHYHSLGDPATMKGTVAVPVSCSLAQDNGDSRIVVRWSSSTMPGEVFDVRYRVEPSGGSTFGPWTTWSPPGTSGSWSTAHALFTPTGGGTYQFQSRLHNVSTGNTSGFSPSGSVNVPV